MARPNADYRNQSRRADRRIVLISGDSTRTFTIRPWIAGLVAVAGAALSVAYLGATTYLVFRDDLLNAAFTRNADLQQAYEDRIASLRSEIDKIASRQILEQVAFDEKVDRLIAAHQALGDRSRVVNELIRQARDSGLLAETAPTDPAADQRADAAAYAPQADDTTAEAFAPLQAPAIASLSDLPRDDEGRPDLRAMAVDIARVDKAQTDAVLAIAAAAEKRAEGVTDIVADLGVRLSLPATDEAGTDIAGVGGPYVPMSSAEALAAALAEADNAFDTLGRLREAMASIPVATPLPGATMTSNFGSRSDPFLGSVAFHAGIDFRAPTGEPVKATAAGTVVSAGRNGGYGNLVEIDHGNGLTTRYAHLSKILVESGDRVAVGEVIGKVGSTGRSTGPHLHYETRLSGTAVNPQSYLRAGRKLANILN